jgi:hypothetical protein
MLNSTMMGLSRQFLNVILGSKRDPAAVKSLSRVYVENFSGLPQRLLHRYYQAHRLLLT